MNRTHARFGLRASLALSSALVAVALPATALAVPADSGAAQVESWTTSLANPAGQEVNARHENGALRIRDARRAPASLGADRGYASEILPVHRLDRPAGRVVAALATRGANGTTTVDVRGRAESGTWTGWQPAGGSATVFDRRVNQVQARITLTAGAKNSSPAVTSVRLSASRAQAAPARPTLSVAAHVFATREGLVGGTTANGHVITDNDHFVALPSARGLSPRDTTDYSVHVCNPANGTCVDAPVWDIGPWNTSDDYWSPSDQRENWGDLPQGTPEAQAAYNDGYNGGLDEFGRAVANPAGIDLADGTFADLGLGDNGYVDVTYLWTAA